MGRKGRTDGGNDIRERIVRDLHDHYSGMKDGKGLEWLVGVLDMLRATPYLGRTANKFLANMPDIGKVTGHLLEVQLLDCLISDDVDRGKLRGEQCVGGSSQPVDVSYESAPAFRADFECKYINSIENELRVHELWNWIDASFPNEDPGALVEIQASTEADERTFQEFRCWFTQDGPGLAFDKDVYFWDARNVGSVKVRKRHSKTKGLFAGPIGSSVPSGQFAVTKDIAHIDLSRKAILARCEKAKGKLAIGPSAVQHSFLVLGVDPLAMFDERDLYRALYGQDICDRTGRRSRDGKGLFSTGKIDYLTAVLLLFRGSNFGEYDIAVFPHPKHESDLDFWLRLPSFRLGREAYPDLVA